MAGVVLQTMQVKVCWNLDTENKNKMCFVKIGDKLYNAEKNSI